MKHASMCKRVLSVLLAVAMLLSFAVPAVSAEGTKAAASVKELELKPIDASTLQRPWAKQPDTVVAEKDLHKVSDVVRVSIVLEKESTIGAGFSTEGIADNAEAKAYREGLKADQAALTQKIEAAIGGKLDVKWNLTLAANIISANVLYGQIDTIKKIDGVKNVELENQYEPQEDLKINEENLRFKGLEKDKAADADEPNEGSASHMIGANIAWANGYTGAGSKVAIIDTGIDKEHQSFSGEGLEYALAQNAEAKGMSYDDYVASLNLLTAEKIDAVKDQLNAPVTGSQAYVSTKIGYGYNYVDNGFDITHENDTQEEHGSHVEGISAANRFIKVGDTYKPALEAVGTQGVAPDAQIVTMKVFGKGGGAYDSDYMSAIEDAIILGCDSANLSLGSGNPGFGFSGTYEKVMNKLVANGMVCSFSAGNSGMWYDVPKNESMEYPYLYIDDNNFATGGSPGSFTNSLTVASVDNVGQTGMPLLFGDKHVFYTETSGYGNAPMASIANETGYDYVLVDGPGVDDNGHVGQAGDQFLALGSGVLSGKIALCYRGSSSFFAKANAAMAQGAKGIIIINNTDGTISMNLTGYTYSAPAVSILKADGDAIKADSEAVTDDQGNVLYYTGHMSIGSELEVNIPEITDTVTVSSFSSFGVPGTLVMKPEILAPGGSIYSVFGYNKSRDGGYTGGHDTYELMSGTSMAAPQVNGMAGVMGQYIRENNLTEKTGLTQRQLTNSLLMSTAHPVFDEYGEYWPVIRVGAGLANVNDAINAKSYILMDQGSTIFPDSAKDGKVKAELGDDPDRNGVYEYKFTLYPMGESKTFSLDTDIFVQDIAGDGGYGMLQYTGSVNLTSLCQNAFQSDTIEGYSTSYKVAGADYAAGSTVTITEPTEITVTVTLSDYGAFLLDYYFTGGAYVQGYTFVNPTANEEGVFDDVIHSIPMLAYYGSWTDASMIDRTSVIDEAYGTGKLPYIGNTNINYLTLKNSNGASSIYMGNPYMVEEKFPADRLAMSSETTIQAANYLPIRNYSTQGFAVQNADGEVILAQSTASDKNGAYYYVNGAVWQSTGSVNYSIGKKLGASGAKEGDKVTVGFYTLPEYYSIVNAKNNGQIATTGGLDTEGFKAILASGIVGDGAAIKYDVTIDDTAPEVKGALQDLISGDVTVTAQDNNYIAYVALLNKSGSKIFAEGLPEQNGPGEEISFPLETEGQVLPDTVVLLVADYAGNETAYEISLGGSEGGSEFGGTTLLFTASDAEPGSGPRAWELDPDELTYNHNTGDYTGISVFGSVPAAVRAAEYVDGYIFMAATDGWFYAAPINALDEAERVGQYDGTIYDMAFNYADKQLYALGEGNSIYTVDLLTGELTLVATLAINNPGSTSSSYKVLMGLAIDPEGNFYGVNYGSSTYAFLYKWTLDDVVVPERDVNLDGAMDDLDVQAILDKVSGKLAADAPFDAAAADVDDDKDITTKDAYLFFTAGEIKALDPVNNARNGNMGIYFMGNGGGSLAWDANNNRLLAAANYSTTMDYDHYLWVVDTETGKASRPNTVGGTGNGSNNTSGRFYGCGAGLIVVPGANSMLKPTDEPSDLILDPAELNLLRGQTVQASATVTPWTLTDKSVTWASADPAIATVTPTGEITAVSVGETTIDVSTVAEPIVTKSIPVTVEEAPEAQLRGIIWDTDGKGLASVFNTSATNAWQGVAEVGELRWGALVDDTVYGSTEDTMYAYDADTYEVTTLGGIVADWIPSDGFGVPEDMVLSWGLDAGFRVGGLCYNGTYFEVLNPEAGSLNYWDLSSAYASDPMAVIAAIGREDYDYNGTVYPDCLHAIMITESGAVWDFYFNMEGSLIRSQVGQCELQMPGVSDPNGSAKASMVYDTEADFLYIAYYDGSDEVAKLYALDPNDFSRCAVLGDFNEKVWPVTGLYEYEPATDLVLKVAPDALEMYETETAQLKIKVKLGDTNEYTVSVADPTICSYEDGVVTGLKAGSTTITVTTVDQNDAGETLTKEIPVTVKALLHPEALTIAQITNAQGKKFSYLNLADLQSEAITDAPYDVKSGALVGDTYLAASETSLTALSAEDLSTPVDFSYDSATLSAYPPMDIANYPIFVDEAGEVDDHKALFTTSLGWLVTPDYYGWNLSSYFPDMAGICYAGESEDDEGTPIYLYYLMTTAGVIYELDVDYAAGSLSAPAQIDTGITLADQSDASLAYVEDVELDEETGDYVGAAGIIIADNGSQKVYYVDFLTGDIGLCGTLDTTNISGLVGTFDFQTAMDGYEEPEPFVPVEEPTDPGTYPEVNPEIKGVKTAFDFETDPTEAGWTFYNRDNDKYNWIWTPDSDYSELEAYEGTGMIISNSYVNDVGALKPDNFAITPALNLTGYEDANIAMYAKGQDANYPEEVFAFYAGTTPNISEMTKISADFTATGTWTKYTASLKNFAGQENVYVAIRHYNCSDMYILDVDKVMLLTADGEPEPEPPTFETVAGWYFEGDTPTEGWTFVDGDQDGNNWALDSSNAYAGTNGISSASYLSGEVLTPDNWAVSPAINLTGVTGASLNIYAKNVLGSYPDTIALYAGTTSDVSQMTQIKADFEPTGSWKQYTVELPEALQGQAQVYVAIRHYNSEDMYRVCVDNVEIVKLKTSEGDGARKIPMPSTKKADLSFGDKLAKLGDGFGYAKSAAKYSYDASNIKMSKLGETNSGKTASDGINAAEGNADAGQAVLTLTEDNAVTNGLMVVKYDPSALTFVSAESDVNLNSINPTEGVVTFAYAAATAIEANNTLAKLTFSYENEYVNTTVKVYTYERGEDVKVREDPVVIDLLKEDGEHTWVEDTEARIEPTCTEEGTATYVCSKCGETKTEPIEKLPHTPEEIPAVAPTCTETGLTAGSKCSVCGEILEAPQPVDALGHTWNEGEITTEPTCEDAGVKTFTCTVCGETRTEAVSANGHTPEDVAEIPATCTAAGQTAGKKCSVCGAILEGMEIILPAGHKPETIPAVPATCTEGGKSDGIKCSVCGEILVEPTDTPAAGHTPVEIPAVAATCTATGLTAGSKCSVCGEILEAQTETPMIAHTPVEIPAVAATCTTAGLTAGSKCSVCGEILEAPAAVEALGHNWDEGKTIAAATCTAEGVKLYTCTQCGTSRTEAISATGHKASDVAAVEPTCTESGKTAGTVCSVCGAVLSGLEDVPAKGHTVVIDEAVAPTLTAPGKTAGAHCSVCNEILVAQEEIAKLDASELNAILAGAEAVDPDKLTDESAAALAEAIDAAKDALTEPTTQEAIDKAAEDLAEVVKNLELKPDTTELEQVIADAEAIDPETLTDESAAALEQALEDAKKALEEAKKQDEVDAAAAALKDVISNLETKPIEPTPTPTPTPVEPTPTPTPTAPTHVCPGAKFTDMPAYGNWAHDPIDWAIVNNITAGTSDTTFSPSAGCTRAQVVTFLWRAAGSPNPTSSASTFTDVKAGSYYEKAVAWAVENNITKGTSETTFAPNATCTRAQIVTFLYRYEKEPEVASTDTGFSDVPATAYYAKAVAWAVANDITQGTGEGKFSPNSTCTRAQVVTFLYRDIAE